MNPFEDSTPNLTPEELRRALNGDRAGTWARFAGQRSAISHNPTGASAALQLAPAGATGISSTGIRPTPAQIRTAARVRARNPEIFDPKAKEDGGLNLGFTPDPGPEPDYSQLSWKDVVNAGWLGFSFFVAPAATVAGLIAKTAVKTVINQTVPPVPEIIKSPPVAVFDFVEKQTAPNSGEVNFVSPPENLPAPPNQAVFEYTPEGTLTGVFIGAPDPKNVAAAPGVDTSTSITTDPAPTATDAGAGAGTGAGGFGGGYGGDPPSNDGSAYGRE